jgi:hypothetical protein
MDHVIVSRVRRGRRVDMKFIDTSRRDVDWEMVARVYIALLTATVSKVGPQEVSMEDITLCLEHKLTLGIDTTAPGQYKLVLLAEDEMDEVLRTGRNPREAS